MSPNPVRALGIGFAALAGALLAGQLLHRVVLPLDPPTGHAGFAVGDTFGSSAEGFHQEVLGLEAGDRLRMRLTLEPGAAGPPLHVHDGFVETFVVQQGELSIELPGGVRTLKPGEQLEVPAGTPHRPFNATDAPVVVEGPGLDLPARFARCLTLLYPVMDADGPVALQLSVLGNACDTHLAEVPRPVQSVLFGALAPLARLQGYGWEPRRS